MGRRSQAAASAIWLALALVACRIRGRRLAEHAGEVAGQVRLIGVAERVGERGPVDRFDSRHPASSLLQAIPADYPFRPHPDMLGEQPLQSPYGEAETRGEKVDSVNPGLCSDGFYDSRGEVC